jgi:hypothetical protein
MSKDLYPESAWVFYFMKKCSKCQIEKPLDKFYKNKSTKEGYDWYCKLCIKLNPKRIEKSKQYQLNNKEKITNYGKQYYIDNKLYFQEYDKKYNKENQIKILEYNKKYNKLNPHLCRWRGLLKDFLKSKNIKKHTSTYDLLKYTPQELKEHLENQGMNWNKHQIDHKIPITWFKPETPPYIVNDLRNLQPLNEKENKSKNNRYSHPIPEDYLCLIKEWVKEEYKQNLEI